MVNRDGMQVVCIKDGVEKSRHRVPIDDHVFETLRIGQYLVLLFSGRRMLAIDLDGNDHRTNILDATRIGRCMTRLFPGKDNTIIFGTKSFGRTQFVKYDFLRDERICQTLSWNLDTITDATMPYDINHTSITNDLYGVLGASFIVKCDMSTGKTVWNRFDQGNVVPEVHLYRRGLIYGSQGLLKYVEEDQQETFRIPGVNISSIEYSDGSYIYVTSNEKKNLACCNLTENEPTWVLKSDEPIRQSLVIKGEQDAKVVDIMLARLQGSVSVINLSEGQVIRTIACDGVTQIDKNGPNVLIHRLGGSTDILEGQNVG